MRHLPIRILETRVHSLSWCDLERIAQCGACGQVVGIFAYAEDGSLRTEFEIARLASESMGEECVPLGEGGGYVGV